MELTELDGVEGVLSTTCLRRVTLAFEVARGRAQAVDHGVLVPAEALLSVLDHRPGSIIPVAVVRAVLYYYRIPGRKKLRRHTNKEQQQSSQHATKTGGWVPKG